MTAYKNNRTCKKGHHYFITSDCPTCPIYEQERKPQSGFFCIVGSGNTGIRKQRNRNCQGFSKIFRKRNYGIAWNWTSFSSETIGRIEKT